MGLMGLLGVLMTALYARFGTDPPKSRLTKGAIPVSNNLYCAP